MEDSARARNDINIAMEILRRYSAPPKSGKDNVNLLEDVAVYLTLRCDPKLHKTHDDRTNSSYGRIHERTTKGQGANQE